MDAREELVDLAAAANWEERIAELDEARAKDLLAVALQLLRDARAEIPLNPDLGPLGFYG